MALLPLVKKLVVNAAVPLELSGTAGPRGVVPDRNVTLPVGIALPLTVAVKATEFWMNVGLVELTSVTVAVTGCTTMETVPVAAV
jgi:hypothetical protein